jgi:hypothetical protein
VAVAEYFDVHDLCESDGIYVGEQSVNLYAAGPSTSVMSRDHEHLLSYAPKLLDLEPIVVGKGPEPFREPFAHLFSAKIRSGCRWKGVRDNDQDYVLIEGVQGRAEVTSTGGFEQSPDYVLLRYCGLLGHQAAKYPYAP